MPIHNLIEYNDNHLKNLGNVYQFCRVITYQSQHPITDSESSKFKSRLIEKSNNDSTVNIRIDVPLK